MGPVSLGKLMEIYSQLLVPIKLPGVPDTGNAVKKATRLKQRGSFQFPMNTIAKFPITNDEIPVSHFLYAYWMDTGRIMKPTPIDPTIFTDLGVKYDYRNDLTEESVVIPADEVPLGFDTVLEAGKFYQNPKFKFAYYCESIKDNIANMFLIESYQHGIFMQAEFQITIDQQNHFVEITDTEEVARLTSIYKNLVNSNSAQQNG